MENQNLTQNQKPEEQNISEINHKKSVTKQKAGRNAKKSETKGKSIKQKTQAADKSANIVCEYKFKLEDSVGASLFVYKKKHFKKSKKLLYIIPAVFVLCVGLLIWDIIEKSSIGLDIFLLALLLAAEVMLLFTPQIIKNSVKKQFKLLNFADADKYVVEMDDKYIRDSLIKDDKAISQTLQEFKNISLVGEDDERIYIVYGSGAIVSPLRKDSLKNVSADELITKLKVYEVDYKINNSKKKI